MAQNVSLWGATYSDTPGVTLPTSGGGTVTFYDVSSTTAVDADVASGKIYFKSDGTQSTGTATVGGGGGGGGVIDTVTTLTGGGEYHEIVGADLSSDTVTAAHLEYGYTAHDASGTAITGTLVPTVNPTIQSLSVTQNGTYTAPSGVDGYSPITVNVGSVSATQKQINFIDYDGTILHSYTKAEITAMTQENDLPSNPSHTGLTAQGWNWTLAQIKAQLTACPDGPVWVGQMYTTSDGKTRLYIYIDPGTPSNRMIFAVRCTPTVANGVTIDWGDGTTTDTDSTSAKNYSHTYSTAGEFVIVLTVNSGTVSFVGGSANSIYGTSSANYAYNRGRIQRAEIGNNVSSLGNYAFSSCYSMTNITIPKTVTAIGTYTFSYCHSLKNVTIPNTVASIGNNAFTYCYALKNIAIPSGLTSIVGSVFYNCYTLTSIAIPSGVTSIGSGTFSACYSLTHITIPSLVTSLDNNAFQNCYGVGEYHLKPTTPPTITSSSFANIQSSCKIYVPYSEDHSVLNNYQTANNWSDYATKMVEEAAP